MLPEHSSFFADPHAPDLTASEEGTVQLLLEIQPSDQTPVRSDFAAWRLLLDSKLANMTACGHLADTLLNKIYFSSLQERGGNLVPLQKSDPKKRCRSFLRSFKTGGYEHIVVRIEVSNCHVFLLELPGLEGNPAYHIESAIRIRDSRITSGLPVDMLQELLDHPPWTSLKRSFMIPSRACSVWSKRTLRPFVLLDFSTQFAPTA